MDLPALPTPYLTWLAGQSVAVVILLAWIWSLHRREKRMNSILEDSRRRNDELSDRLVETLLEASRERSERRESIMRAALEAIEKRLGE
jgi:hypothetical protein